MSRSAATIVTLIIFILHFTNLSIAVPTTSTAHTITPCPLSVSDDSDSDSELTCQACPVSAVPPSASASTSPTPTISNHAPDTTPSHHPTNSSDSSNTNVNTDRSLRKDDSLRTSSVIPTVLSDSEEGAISPLLFGTPRPLLAAASKLAPGIHPRIVFDADEWQTILHRYSRSQSSKSSSAWSQNSVNSAHHNNPNSSSSSSWASLYRAFSVKFGTKSPVIVALASVHRSGMTARYQSRPYSSSSSYQTYHSTLAPLAAKIVLAKPASGLNSLFLCALWALVDNEAHENGKEEQQQPQPQNNEPLTQCLNATYAWSTIVLAHRSFHCNPVCPQAGSATDRAYLWDTKRLWGIHHDWFLGCGALALTYDVLYPHMSPAFRTRVRSALAMIVHERIAWGITNNDTSASTSGSLFSSNVYTEPHRSYSLSVARNAALFLATLAIEGEHIISLLDPYAWSVATSFNAHAITAYAELLHQYFHHAFHPDGSPIDADDAYPVALRDAALALVALERRQRGFLSSPRFRNVVHHVLQTSSPSFSTNAPCSTQPALRDPTHVALFRYVFPSGALPNMLWVRRLSFEFKDPTCHALAFESAPHLAILGDEVDVEYKDPVKQGIETAATKRKDIHSIRQLPPRLQALIPTTYYATRRGLFVSRSHLNDPAATHVTFDCRPDAFLLEHHRADRGIFTLSTHGVPWFVDIPWNLNGGSTRHSLMHIDGIGQIAAAPPCRTLSVRHTGSDGALVIAAGDLSDAYRVHWAVAPHAHPPVLRHVVTVDYHDHNQAIPLPRSIVRRVNFTERELRTPWDYGWPKDDNASDIGFTRNMSLYGTPGVGTQGLWFWRRTFRNVQHVVRSLISGRENVVIVVDSVKMGHSDEPEEQEVERMHVFESFVILHPAVSVVTPTESACDKARGSCLLRLMNSATKSIVDEVPVVDLYAFASYGQEISVRVDQIPLGTHESRLVIRSTAQTQEDIWLVFQPHIVPRSEVQANANHTSQVFEFRNRVLKWSSSSDDYSIVYLQVDPVSHAIVTTKSNEAASGNSSATQNLLPMMPSILTPWNTRSVPWQTLEDNHAKFFASVTSPHARQTVLRVYALSSAQHLTEDVFRVCVSSPPLVVTSLALYKCPNHSAYGNRSCTTVHRISQDTAEESTNDSNYDCDPVDHVGVTSIHALRLQVGLERGVGYHLVASVDVKETVNLTDDDIDIQTIVIRHEAIKVMKTNKNNSLQDLDPTRQ